MRKPRTQYTVRGVPAHVDQELRQRASREHRSLNEVTLQALQQGLGGGVEPVRHHDLDAFIGAWVADPGFDEAMAALHQIDPALWA